MNYTSEIHPFKSFIPENAKSLIIGTFPPTKNKRSFEFFYPNKTNLFWTIMGKIFGYQWQYMEGPDAAMERETFLKKNKIGITDSILECSRKNNNAKDENLEVIQKTDVLSFISQYTSISKILLTSSSGKVSALSVFNLYLKEHGLELKIRTGKKPFENNISYKGREIKVITLYSPSRRAANRISFDSLVEMYRKELT